MTDPPALSPSAYEQLAAPLHGATIRLVPLDPGHGDQLHQAFQEVDLWRWQGKQPATRQDTTAWIDQALAQAAQRLEVPFVIETHQGELAGATRYLDLRWQDAGVEIGWTMVFSQYRRTRVNTEAKFLLLQRAFEQVGCARVQLKTDALNARSRAAIERLGARFEGIHRCHKRRANGTLRDTAFFSITYLEWPGIKQRLSGFLHS